MNEREIRKLIKIVEESEIEELEVRRWWGYRLRISKRAAGGPQSAPTIPVPPEQPSPADRGRPAEAAGGGEGPPAETAAERVEETYPEARYHIIRSPIVGTFYRAPAPDAPPYVEEGDTIKAGQVVCIVEAMKLMNEIQAEQGGRVVKVLTENAQPVEYSQKLIVIDPEG
ncbi:MAG: acetyl-CoA carboxylase biotin carboxyl carrier protein [bacterium]